MSRRATRSRNRRKKDTILFVTVLLVGVAGFGLLAAYENGYFEDTTQEARLVNDDVDDRNATGRSADTTHQSGPSSSGPVSGQLDLLHQPTLLTGSESNEALYESLSDSERECLQHIADAVDATLEGGRYRGELTLDDLEAAEKYSTLINSARWREFWYRTAVRTAGFPKFQRLRDRGDEEDFKSAAVAWVQLDGFTRGIVLEALQAIEEGDEDLVRAHEKIIEQYPFILGIDEREQPLRAPRP